MKYTIETIISTEHSNQYLLFWGHQRNKEGSISKSCFSQWWTSNFVVEGVTYLTAEHFMMAKKAKLFKDDVVLDKIIACKTPEEAKKLGRQVKNYDQKTWEDSRFEIVKLANYFKFTQNLQLKEFLIETKTSILVEASPVDSIWGIGLAAEDKNAQNPKEWKGLNLLGFALMEVRDQLINEKK
ncbi:NADAR family protein [Olleya sp. HaHaR_3_96]|uniref:NADAR family protein n=1 Tax=Olleya sp. HaHaR_3_96 TaxID=2745560 RepID=UPI001C4FC0A0|nr:NADAR family protein [Olleya sp. HaHaR_3_96]QXP61079.1 NADAR family protein [Olleya sp. HaHaR_3_96]